MRRARQIRTVLQRPSVFGRDRGAAHGRGARRPLALAGASEGVVADGDGGAEDAEHEEGLRGRLVLDVVRHGVLRGAAESRAVARGEWVRRQRLRGEPCGASWCGAWGCGRAAVREWGRARLDEVQLREHLGKDESEKDRGVEGLSDGVEVGGHAELRDVDRRDANVLGRVDAWRG